jgi:hypothetical protein
LTSQQNKNKTKPFRVKVFDSYKNIMTFNNKVKVAHSSSVNKHRTRMAFSSKVLNFAFVFVFFLGVGVILVEAKKVSPPLNILWDLSRGVKPQSGSTIYDPRVNGSYFQDGLNVFRAQQGFFFFSEPSGCLSLDQYPLQVFDLFLSSALTSRNGNYSNSELAAITNFVNLGGSLLVNFDDPTADPNYLPRSILQSVTGLASLDTATAAPNGLAQLLSGLLGLVFAPTLYFNAGAELAYDAAATLKFFSATQVQAQQSILTGPFTAFTMVEKCNSSCRILTSCDSDALLRPDMGPAGAQNLQVLQGFITWFKDSINMLENVTSQITSAILLVENAIEDLEKVSCDPTAPVCSLTLLDSPVGEIGVNVELGLVSEINPLDGSIVKSVDFTALPFLVNTLNSLLDLAGLRYQAVGPSGELLQLAFQPISTATNTSFAGENFILPAGSLEWTVVLNGWNWVSDSDHVRISFPIWSNTSSFLFYTSGPDPDGSNSTLYYIYSRSSRVRLQLANVAIIDGCASTAISHSLVGLEQVTNIAQAKMRNDWNETWTVTLEIVFPHFNNFIIYDPDMGALVGGIGPADTTSGTAGDGATGDGTTNLLLIVLTSVLVPVAALGVLGVVAGVIFVLWQKRKSFGDFRLFGAVQFSELEESGEQHPPL